MDPVGIDRLAGDDWQVLRDVRLAALEESPHAFWAKLSDESRYGRAEWVSFLEAVTWFVARRGGLGVGVAGLLVPEQGDPELIGMWVAPTERGRGTGERIALAVLDCARSRGATSVGLWVTEGNDAARTLYQRLGFVFTGEWAPLPHDAAAGEHRMTYLLSEAGRPTTADPRPPSAPPGPE